LFPSFESALVLISYRRYSTGKLIFFYYLVCDNYSVCSFIYDTHISVYFLKHKADIDNRFAVRRSIENESGVTDFVEQYLVSAQLCWQ
jgi:hypothetical protein